MKSEISSSSKEKKRTKKQRLMLKNCGKIKSFFTNYSLKNYSKPFFEQTQNQNQYDQNEEKLDQVFGVSENIVFEGKTDKVN
jgi:hypothetical protein